LPFAVATLALLRRPEVALPERPNPSALARLAPVLVLAATFLAYAGVSSFGFVYDDEAQIVHDSFVQHWRFVPAYFTSHVWQWIYPHVAGNYYRPVFLVWLLLNFKLFGLHAAGWHLAVLALHLVVTWQVYRLALRLLGTRSAALVAALLFGLHPIHIEAVAWISGVTEPLAAALMLASFLSWIRYRKNARRLDFAWSLVWFALALLTKETAILLPVMLFAYDLLLARHPQTGSTVRVRASLTSLTAFPLVAALYMLARMEALHAFSSRVTDVSLSQNLLTIPSLLIFYGRLLVWPVGLSAFYDTRYVVSFGDALLPLLLCLAAAAGVAYALYRTRSRVAAFALVLLLVPLAPLMKLDVFFRGEIAHDRYLYLPSVGFVLVIAILFRAIAGGPHLPAATLHTSPEGSDGQMRERRRRLAIAGVAFVALLFFAATLWQSLYWANNLVLFGRGVAIAPNNLIVRTDLANELMQRGRRDVAMEQYRDVLQRDPSFWLARYNLGYAEYAAGDCAAAVRDLDLAARQNPLDAETFFYLGDCRFRLGEQENGAALMRHGIELDPRLPNFRAKLADALAATADPQNLRQAVELYRAEASANPAHPYAAARAAEVAARLGSGR
jgi:protein O-mannosyl-transferase